MKQMGLCSIYQHEGSDRMDMPTGRGRDKRGKNRRDTRDKAECRCRENK
jgi:hypothetical protein